MNKSMLTYVVLLTSLAVFEVSRVFANVGGPDGYGYRFYDNIVPDTTTYDWIELRDDPQTTWINAWAANHDDAYSYEGPTPPGDSHQIGFSFPFYASFYDLFRVCTNGFIQFTTLATSYNNAALPASAVLGPAIFPYWDDLHLNRAIADGVDVVGFRNFGTYTVIEFDSIGVNNSLCLAPNNRLKYEVILYEDGKIKVQYNIVDVCNAQDSSMTVGIQSGGVSGSAALQYCLGTGTQGAMNLAGHLPAAGRAIWFMRVFHTSDFAISTIISPSGIQAPNSYMTVTGRFSNYGMSAESCPVRYQFNEDPVISEQTPIISPSGGNATYTFAAQIPAPSILGVYPLAIWADSPSDEERRNDTIHVNVNVNWDGFACNSALQLTTAGPDSLTFNNCGAGTNDPGVSCTANSYDDMVFMRTVDAGHTVSFWISSLAWTSKYPNLSLRWGGACPGNVMVDCIATNNASQYLKYFTWTNTTGSTQDAYFVVGHYTGTTPSYCGNFKLAWVDQVCEPIDPPLTEGFENVPYVPVLPNCWMQENVNGVLPNWESYGTNPRTGTKCGSIGSLAAGNDDWMFSQGINMVEGGDYTISYWRRVTSTNYPDSIEVKTGLAPTAGEMTIQVAAYDTCRSTAYINKQCGFVCPASGVYYVGWHSATRSSIARTYIDDIAIDVSTECTGGTVTVNSAVAADSVTLTTILGEDWSGGTPRYQWYTDVGCVNGNQISAATSSTYKTYTSGIFSCRVYVIDSMNCVACDSASATVFDCVTPPSLPMQEGFQYVTVPALPNCWTQENTDNASPVWQTSASYAHSTPNSAYIGTGGYTTLNDWLFSPGFQLSADTTYLLEFYFSGGPSVVEYLEVKFGTTPSSGGMTSGTIVSQFSFNGTGYGRKSNRFTPPQSGRYYIGWHATGTDAIRVTLDDVLVSAIAPCANVQELSGMLPISISGNTTGAVNDFDLVELGFPVQTPSCWPSPYSPARYDQLSCCTGPDVAYSWTPDQTGTYRIEVESGTDYDADFLIFNNTCPNIPTYATDFICGSDDWGSDRSHLDLNLTAGQSYLIVVGGHGQSSGSFTLTIAYPGRCCYGDPITPNCEINTEEQCDALSGSWTLGEACTDCRPIIIFSPNGGENWVVGDMDTIRWARGSATTGDVAIQINRTFPTGDWEQIVTSAPNTGSYSWLVISPLSTTARIRIMSLSVPGAGDTSDFDFDISMDAGNAFALALDGSGDYVDCGNPACLDLTANMTIEAWVRFGALLHPQTIVSKDAGSGGNNKWIFGWSQDYEPAYQRLILHQNGSCADWGATSSIWIPNIGQWYHVAVVADNTSRTFYVNGQSIGSAVVACTLPHVEAPVLIGQAEGQFNLAGTIGDVRIWNLPRSQPQLQANMSMRLAGNEPGLVGYWQLNEISGGVAYDSSPCNNDGTLYGDARFIPSTIPIVDSELTVIVPNGSEGWLVATSQTILWNTGTTSSDVRIEINRTYPSEDWETLESSIPNTGSYNWTVTSPPSTATRIRITSTLDSEISDTSNADFSIVGPSLTIESPNGGETWLIGDTTAVFWASIGAMDDVRIEINRTYPSEDWETLESSIPNTGSYNWTVTSPPSTATRIRITSTLDSEISDTSNADFSIVGPSLTIESPNGGETWRAGDANAVTWTSLGVAGNVLIELNRTYPEGVWETVALSTPDTGSYIWTITSPPSCANRIRITSLSMPSIGDTSDSEFCFSETLGQVLALDGNGDYVNCGEGTSLNLTADMTIEAWVRFDDLTRPQTIVSKDAASGAGNKWIFSYSQDYQPVFQKLLLHIRNSSCTAWAFSNTWIPLLGHWYHVALVKSSDTCTFFVDGIEVGTATLSCSLPVVSAPLMIGQAEGQFNLDGKISDVRIWNVTRSPQQIQDNMNERLADMGPGLVGYWQLNETGDYTAYDASSYGNNGTLAGNAHFVQHTTPIDDPMLELLGPNGGETWIVTEAGNLTWTSLGLVENVKIELNRAYPGPTWETVFANTPNDYSESWVASDPTSNTARIRITGVNHTTVGDTSDANFAIGTRSITIIAPDGGENWSVGSSHGISWISQNLSDSVHLDINRNYPAGGWESLETVIADDGVLLWTVTPPTSVAARVRVVSVNNPSVSDISSSNFAISPANARPVLIHDNLHDQSVDAFTVTAIVTDDAGGFETYVFHRLTGATVYDSILMTAASGPNEYAAAIGPLDAGSYEYFLRVRDVGDQTDSTSPFTFFVGDACGVEQVYDDETAERSNWSSNSNYKWAVQFTATASPFNVCNARVGLSTSHPDAGHSPILVEIMLADGPGDLPGTIVWSRTVGSIGNEIGGLGSPPVNWTYVVIRDSLGGPLVLTENFFVSVSNPNFSENESFLQDTASSYLNRSYVYDPCDSLWYNENASMPSTRLGNRLIRVSGYELVAPSIVIYRSGNDLRLDWNSTGAPFYRVYYSLASEESYTLISSVSATTFIDENAASNPIKFYIVRASMTP